MVNSSGIKAFPRTGSPVIALRTGAGPEELRGVEVTWSGFKPQPSNDAPHCMACPFCKNRHNTWVLQKASEAQNTLFNALSQNNETHENIKLGPIQLKMLLSRETCLWISLAGPHAARMPSPEHIPVLPRNGPRPCPASLSSEDEAPGQGVWAGEGRPSK